MDQSKSNHLSRSGEGVTKIVTAERFWYFLLAFVSFASGILLLLTPQPEIVLGFVILILTCLLLFFHPILGILAYVILSYTRIIEDYIPPLANLHFTRLLSVVLIVIWSARTALTTKKIFLWRKEFNLLYIFLLIMGISIPFSFWPTYSFDSYIEFLKTFIIVFVMVHVVDDLKEFRALIWVFILVHTFLAIAPMRMFVTLGSTAVQMRLGTTTRGFLGDANDFALALNIALPFVYYLFMSGKGRFQRFFLVASLIVLFLGIISTSSRGGFITVLVTIFYLIFKSKKKLIGIQVVVLLLSAMLIVTPKEFWQRQATTISYQEDPSALGRTTAWEAGINMFLDRPLNGVGLSCFSIAYGARYHLPTVRAWISAHNAYIQILAELGLLGLACYLLLIYLVYHENTRLQKSMKKTFLKEDFYLTISQALKASLIAYAVGSLFLSTAYYPHLYMLIGFTLINKLLFARELELVSSQQVEGYCRDK